MPKIKKKAKALMQPQDEIKSMAHNVSDYYQVYQKQFNLAIMVIVLALAVTVVYSFVQSGNEKKASQMLSAAYDAYNPGGGAPANYPQALQRFQAIVKQYGGTVNGAIAQFYTGNTYVQMGQQEAALLPTPRRRSPPTAYARSTMWSRRWSASWPWAASSAC